MVVPAGDQYRDVRDDALTEESRMTNGECLMKSEIRMEDSPVPHLSFLERVTEFAFGTDNARRRSRRCSPNGPNGAGFDSPGRVSPGVVIALEGRQSIARGASPWKMPLKQA